MEDGYGRGSTIITAQLLLSKWYDYLNESTITDAIINKNRSLPIVIEIFLLHRFLFNCVIINIVGI